MQSTFKTFFLLAVLTVLLVLIGQMVGGIQGATFALVVAAVMNFASYWFSDKLVLKMYRAKPLDESQAPGVHRIVRGLAQRAGMPMPRLYWLPAAAPNAFATGRNPQHAAIAVTAGLLQTLREEELEGVLAHELSHIKNRDTLVMSVAATLAGAIMWLADIARWGLFFGGGDDDSNANPALRLIALIGLIILAPIAAMLVQMAISRQREFGADATGARVAGSPQGLASALEKLEDAAHRTPLPQGNAATAHLFIVNPLRMGSLAELFATHPPMAERIRRLRSMRL